VRAGEVYTEEDFDQPPKASFKTGGYCSSILIRIVFQVGNFDCLRGEELCHRVSQRDAQIHASLLKR
jgi:hypothetical protein